MNPTADQCRSRALELFYASCRCETCGNPQLPTLHGGPHDHTLTFNATGTGPWSSFLLDDDDDGTNG